MQVNLLHHPEAFPDVPTGLRPEVNTRYAIIFLNSLHARFGNWAEAIANYHSADAERGVDSSSPRGAGPAWRRLGRRRRHGADRRGRRASARRGCGRS